jgi:hypothetical protein
MDHELHFYDESAITSEFQSSWEDLFARCYGSSVINARKVFEKYQLNTPHFSAMYAGGNLVGCYSGLELGWGEHKVFLSTDTMSDGTIRSGTVKMATHLYDQLRSRGVKVVVGYPNDNIRSIRVKKLGWSMEGKLYLWVGVPLISELIKARSFKHADLWSLNRPTSGFFGKIRSPFRLVTPHRGYGSMFGVPITLSARRPGLFFLKVPTKVVAGKTFGYLMLSDDESLRLELVQRLSSLNIDTIDLP